MTFFVSLIYIVNRLMEHSMLLNGKNKVTVNDVIDIQPSLWSYSLRQKRCMGKLLEFNADVNICNNEGLTAVSTMTPSAVFLLF